jgi:hypothetical protein
MTIAATIESLTDRQAVRVLALVVDRQGPLPDPARLREIAQATADPELDQYRQPSPAPPTPGELARATLGYLATADPTLGPAIDRAARLTDDGTRFEPATIAIGGLVLLALQTELKLERNTAGKWSFKLHKKPMRDGTLGQLIGKLLALTERP